MIHDAQDGTSGRRVWLVAGPGLGTPVYVIASSASNALAWVEQAAETGLPGVTATDAGSADRTEIGVWRDESYLDLPNAPTDTTQERGA